ncbi:MAG: hypothetical protein E7262_04335 [Lachnospiraceae bacterium]|nr:hypothetical protein [Lachnospiraceae bacterium]
MTDKEKRILDVLKKSNNALSAKEIAVMMYGPDSAQQLVYSKLLKLEALGLVEKYYAKRSYKFIYAGDDNVIRLDKPSDRELEEIEEAYESQEINNYEEKNAHSNSMEQQASVPTPIRTRKKEYDVYERENFLKLQFNEVWSSILKEKKDYYSYMDEHSLDLLRNAVTNLKNINTLKTTLWFISKIKDIFNVSDKEVAAVEESVRTAPPHYEGYDVEHTGLVNVIAEIKCNMPINNSNTFEPVQINEIKRDLEFLINGKKKSKIKDISKYYRFLVVKKHGKNLGFAVQELIKELPIEISKFLLVYREGMIMSKDYIYIYILEK